MGRELKTPLAISNEYRELFIAIKGSQFQTSLEPGGGDMSEKVNGVREETFRRLCERCHKNLRSYFLRQGKNYDLRQREVRYDLADLVVRRPHVL